MGERAAAAAATEPLERVDRQVFGNLLGACLSFGCWLNHHVPVREPKLTEPFCPSHYADSLL